MPHMSLQFTSGLLYLGLILLTGCAKSPVDRAQAFLEANMASEAVPLLKIEIQADPRNARAHLLLGQAALLLNDREAARESFGRAVLLNPGWTERVGRSYLDAANKLIGGDPSELDLGVSYLRFARESTQDLDKEIARSMRRAGLRRESVALLRAAVEIDASLAKDDSVAAYLAADPAQDPVPRMAALEGFLDAHPNSKLRPAMLLGLARMDVVAGDRPRAKARAEEAARAAADPETKAAALALLQEIGAVEQGAAEAEAAARQAEASRQEALAQRTLADQEAEGRRIQARAAAQSAQANAELERKARAEANVRRAQSELLQAIQVLPGRWEFVDSPDLGSARVGGYIDFQTVGADGSVSGEFVFPNWDYPRNPFQGRVASGMVTIIRDCTPPGGIKQRWTGRLDLEARSLRGVAEGIIGQDWHANWAATKR